MIQPYSKLPWKEVLNKKKQKYQLYAADNLTCVVENVPNLADAMYIEEACNNYLRAVELLEAFDNEYSDDHGLKQSVTEFLKQIKND